MGDHGVFCQDNPAVPIVCLIKDISQENNTQLWSSSVFLIDPQGEICAQHQKRQSMHNSHMSTQFTYLMTITQQINIDFKKAINCLTFKNVPSLSKVDEELLLHLDKNICTDYTFIDGHMYLLTLKEG
ncbi:hypothetical protein CHARACLAT_008316 [Characodon lateralis]|uniref:Uncharacterized protein n=1 Tax=Characodon lateralis TaxID=208331 RepID=A0ABU7CM92_9TELE|nr:hypothetical protein [Characodon lateralis]